MPERIVRPGILTSESINSLSWAAEVFYRRLMSVVDDYGRFDGRIQVLRASLYPLQLDHVSDADVRKWRLQSAEAGVVSVYEVDGKEFVQITKFNQRMRGKPRWPAPNDGDPPQLAATRGDCPPSSYSETEAETETGAASGVSSRASPRRKEEIIDIPVGLDDDQFRHWWAEWLAYRREKRKAVTARSAKLQLAELEKMGVGGAIDSIRRSISNGWQGIFPPDGQIAERKKSRHFKEE